MKNISGTKYLTIGEVSKIIKRKPLTIKNWYGWKEQADNVQSKYLPELPVVHRNLDIKRTRYFKQEDLNKLEEFRDAIHYGSIMSDYNRKKNWGKYGSK